MIGQRVILNRSEIGTIVRSERPREIPKDGYQWVMSPSRGYPSQYSECNIQPLPNGQL